MVGKKAVKNMIDHHFLALQRLNVQVERDSECQYYKRIIVENELIHSKQYTRVKKRNSYTVLLKDDGIFEIDVLIVVRVHNKLTCYALGTYLPRCSYTIWPSRKLQHITFIQFEKRSVRVAAIEVTCIKQKVNIVVIPNGTAIACKHPNRFELLT